MENQFPLSALPSSGLLDAAEGYLSNLRALPIRNAEDRVRVQREVEAAEDVKSNATVVDFFTCSNCFFLTDAKIPDSGKQVYINKLFSILCEGACPLRYRFLVGLQLHLQYYVLLFDATVFKKFHDQFQALYAQCTGAEARPLADRCAYVYAFRDLIVQRRGVGFLKVIADTVSEKLPAEYKGAARGRGGAGRGRGSNHAGGDKHLTLFKDTIYAFSADTKTILPTMLRALADAVCSEARAGLLEDGSKTPKEVLQQVENEVQKASKEIYDVYYNLLLFIGQEPIMKEWTCFSFTAEGKLPFAPPTKAGSAKEDAGEHTTMRTVHEAAEEVTHVLTRMKTKLEKLHSILFPPLGGLPSHTDACAAVPASGGDKKWSVVDNMGNWVDEREVPALLKAFYAFQLLSLYGIQDSEQKAHTNDVLAGAEGNVSGGLFEDEIFEREEYFQRFQQRILVPHCVQYVNRAVANLGASCTTSGCTSDEASQWISAVLRASSTPENIEQWQTTLQSTYGVRFPHYKIYTNVVFSKKRPTRANTTSTAPDSYFTLAELDAIVVLEEEKEVCFILEAKRKVHDVEKAYNQRENLFRNLDEMFNSTDESNYLMSVKTRPSATRANNCIELGVNMFRAVFSAANAAHRSEHFVFVTSIPFPSDASVPETNDSAPPTKKNGAAPRWDCAMTQLPTSGYSSHLLVIELSRMMGDHIFFYFQKFMSAFCRRFFSAFNRGESPCTALLDSNVIAETTDLAMREQHLPHYLRGLFFQMTQKTLLASMLAFVGRGKAAAGKKDHTHHVPDLASPFRLELVQKRPLPPLKAAVAPTAEEKNDLQRLFLYYVKHHAALVADTSTEGGEKSMAALDALAARCAETGDAIYYTDFLLLKDDFLSPLLREHRKFCMSCNAKGRGRRPNEEGAFDLANRFDYTGLKGIAVRLQQREKLRKKFIDIVKELMANNSLRLLLMLNLASISSRKQT